ncbi:MAG: thioredoxin domain-containing protein, partial [Defluviicoccus sp.]|nr:thioredoxin domain-containing protein [Defluviicoccus sp.]
ARWLVPHFEKMLYDNAQLLDLLTAAWKETANPLYEARIRETVGWVLREMIAEGGGFAATLDADSEGEEGKFYVWTEGEIDAALGTDAALFKTAYDVSADGNWEGKAILHRNHGAGPFEATHEARLAACRETLLELRAERIRPGWDDKVLADWNGLMIAAMANAAAVFGEPEWLEAARTAYRFVAETMQADGRLFHAHRDGRTKHAATLDDYAAMARAALALNEVTGDASCLAQAEAWVAALDAHYWDAAEGGYFLTADDAEALIVRTKSADDDATPSGNGLAAEVLARLALITGEARYRDRAEALIAAFSGQIGRNFFPLATLMNASEMLLEGAQVVVAGARKAGDTQALLDAAFRAPAVARTIAVVEPGTELPRSHPAHGKGGVDGRAAAFVCVGQTCSLPATDADGLRAAMARG